MADTTPSRRQSNRLFILVCANFTMLAVLFIGLGILLFQSINLVGSLNSDPHRAAEFMAHLHERVERIESEAPVERIVGAAVGSIREEVRQAVTESEPLAALSKVPESIERAFAAAEQRELEG